MIQPSQNDDLWSQILFGSWRDAMIRLVGPRDESLVVEGHWKEVVDQLYHMEYLYRRQQVLH